MYKSFSAHLSTSSLSDHFSIELPSVINFYSNWKVGVSEFFLDCDILTDFSVSDRTLLVRKKSSEQWETKFLPMLCYDSISTIFDALNNVFQISNDHFHDSFKFVIHGSSKLLIFTVTDGSELKFSKKILDLFGLPEEFVLKENHSMFYPYRLTQSSPRFDLICNIAHSSIRDNVYEKVLRHIIFPEKYASTRLKEDFSNIEFHNVTSSNFHSISFSLKQIGGQEVILRNCELSLTLIFRRE